MTAVFFTAIVDVPTSSGQLEQEQQVAWNGRGVEILSPSAECGKDCEEVFLKVMLVLMAFGVFFCTVSLGYMNAHR